MDLEDLIPPPTEPMTDDQLEAIRARYEPFRALTARVNSALVKRVPREVLIQGGKKLGLFRRGVFVFDSESESDILMDFCIHSMLRGGRNLVDECLDKERAAFAEEEIEALQALQAARYAVLMVREVELGYGAYCVDVTTPGSEPFFLADRFLSTTATSSRMTLATRIVPVDDFYMTGGAGMPIVEETPADVLAALAKWLRDSFATWLRDGMCPPRTRMEDAELAAFMVPLLLRHRSSSRIAYGDPKDDQEELLAALEREAQTDSLQDTQFADAPDGSEPYRRGPKVGRNDPCPCGSGLKYKKCCGKNA